MTPADDPPCDARLDPWCLVPLLDGEKILFGFAERHPVTDGLGWTRSTPVKSLDDARGRAVTASGRRYELGRRIEPGEVPEHGEEAWIAFDLLIGPAAADPKAVPPISVDPEQGARWILACKIARHLKLTPPTRIPSEIEQFLALHAPTYIAWRFGAATKGSN
jgi:hypothetical protein